VTEKPVQYHAGTFPPSDLEWELLDPPAWPERARRRSLAANPVHSSVGSAEGSCVSVRRCSPRAARDSSRLSQGPP
jgi:hypothetical protein